MRQLADRLRALVRATVADAVERPYPGWHGIGYRSELAGYFCGIFPTDDAVKLGFERGTSLRDTSSILSGRGTRVRYVVLRPGDRLPRPAIVALLRQAAGLSRR